MTKYLHEKIFKRPEFWLENVALSCNLRFKMTRVSLQELSKVHYLMMLISPTILKWGQQFCKFYFNIVICVTIQTEYNRALLVIIIEV